MNESINGRYGWILLGMFVVLLFTCVAIAGLAYNIDRQASFYPNSQQLASNSRFRLPSLVRWDDSYSTEDDFRQVFTWYSVNFGLGPESAANGNCSHAEDKADYLFLFERYTGVIICDSGDERLVYVNRTTYFNR